MLSNDNASRMHVGDLIHRLQQLDPMLPVVVGGFRQRGFDRLDTVEVIEVVPIAPETDGPDYEAAVAIRASHTRVTGASITALYLGA